MAADETPTLTSPGVVDTVRERFSDGRRGEPWAERSTWLLAWGTKGGFAVTDQALFAGAQFALNIMLARWLEHEDYGAFAVAYAVFLLAAAVYRPLLIEPMIILVRAGVSGKSEKLYGIVLRGHWLLTVPSGLVLLKWVRSRRSYSPPVGHALSRPGSRTAIDAHLADSSCVVHPNWRKPGRAAAGGAIFFCGLLALLWWLHAEEMLTPGTAILATGVASLIAAGLHLVWLRPERFQEAKKLGPAEVASEHWAYGRWVLAAVLPSWTLLNFYYVVLPVWFGLKQAGELKAIMNLSMPAIHSLIAFGVLMIPLFVRHLEVGGRRLMRQTVRRVTSVFVAGAGAYFVLLWFFRIQIIHLLYGGKYVEDSGHRSAWSAWRP